MRWRNVVSIAMKWPEVTEGISYGEPSLKVRKRLLTRVRLTNDSLVLLDIPSEERDVLIAAAPQTFFTEDHYRGYDIVLARLENISAREVETFLERRWRSSATKRAISEFDKGLA